MARRHDEPTAKPTNDAYTGMLAVSLLALVIGCVVLFLDYNRYPAAQPPQLISKFGERPPFEAGKEPKAKEEIPPPDEVPGEKKDKG